MARNFSFLKRKRFWVLCIVGIVGILVVFFLPAQKTEEPISLHGVGGGDSIFPVSQIVQPHENAVMGRNFSVAVRDVDAGGSGIAKDQCRYSIYDCGSFPCVQTVSDAQRTCNESFLVSLGKDKACSTQGRDACRIVVKSQDLAGNKNMQSEAQGSIKTFGVDLIAPKVTMELPFFERASLGISFEASVTDNVEVSNCNVTIGKDGQHNLALLQFSAHSCTEKNEKACYLASGSHIFSVSGTYEFSLGCWDLAGNTGRSETYKIEAIQNRSPQVSSCRVTPTLGTAAAEFLFQGEASDPDGDAMIYKWEFGDNTTALGREVSHQYEALGVYTPQVTVTDSYGAEERCSTAWVVVGVGETKE